MKFPNNVLVIDRSQTFSMYLSLLLQRMGLKSMSVNGPGAAKAVLDLGFTDFLIVGDQNGTEPIHVIVRQLAEGIIDNSIPIIVVSTCNDPAEMSACYDAGCQGFLQKPIQPRLLHEALYSGVTPASERRKHLRCEVDLTVDVAIDSQQPQAHKLINLSKGGALISSSRTLPVGTQVDLHIYLDDLQVHLSGIVLYYLPNKTLPNNTDRKAGAFGVLFHQISQSHADMIDSYMEKVFDQCSLLAMC